MNLYLQLFLNFLQVGLFSVGGGYAAIPLIKSSIVDGMGWLTLSEFTDLITIAEMTPGPIAVNASTFVGTKIAGFPGMISATIGCIFPSCIIVSLLSYVYSRYRKVSSVQNVLTALRPVVVALIASATLSILSMVAFSGKGVAMENISVPALVLCAGAFFLIRKKHFSPMLTMGLSGVGMVVIHYVIALFTKGGIA